MDEVITPEVKAIITWLNDYAFAGWSLTQYSLEEAREINEEGGERWEKLLKDFENAKLEVLQKAKERAKE